METAEALTHWTARGSFALYVLALMLRSRAATREHRLKLARWLWTGACVLMLVHVGFAFSGFHHWSHRAAYDDTARQTAEMFGINWGGGLYANYAMLIVWAVDVLGWWRSGSASLSRPSLKTWLAQGFLAFMWFNATVVFGHGWIRWAGTVGFLALAVCLCLRLRLRKSDYPDRP